MPEHICSGVSISDDFSCLIKSWLLYFNFSLFSMFKVTEIDKYTFNFLIFNIAAGFQSRKNYIVKVISGQFLYCVVIQFNCTYTFIFTIWISHDLIHISSADRSDFFQKIYHLCYGENSVCPSTLRSCFSYINLCRYVSDEGRDGIRLE